MGNFVQQEATARHVKLSLPSGAIDPGSAAQLVSAVADVALVLDTQGTITSVSVSSDGHDLDGCFSWSGRAWADTVTSESRPKIEALLRDAHANGEIRWRQVNHPTGRGPDLPIRYSAMKLGADGPVIAVGRDLSSLAQLQQRLVDAQQSMEREYARLRQAEMRYRQLFQLSSEAVVILEAASLKVVEANPAAVQLFAHLGVALIGRPFPTAFPGDAVRAVERLLLRLRSAGRADDARVPLAGQPADIVVSGSLFRQDGGAHILIRIVPADADGDSAGVGSRASRLGTVIAGMPDGFVVTGVDRRILFANTAFLDLAQLATEDLARGEPIDRWLGRGSVDINVMVANLREHGLVRLFPTVVRGEYGLVEDVEVSCVSVPDGDPPCFGFSLRATGRRLSAEARPGRELPRSAEQLTELIGRVPMREIVGETVELIERLCIEAALQITGDNRASAAEMLGLSRQSLYVKLRRYGLGELNGDDDA